jgi:hypothetical protein
MNALLRTVAAASAALGLVSVGGALAAPATQTMAAQTGLISGVYDLNHPLTLEQTQWVFGGRNYCFYVNGWHGPGYYWCGYAFRRGLGWGGPEGWRGWHRRADWRRDHWRRDHWRRDHWRRDRWRDHHHPR